MIFSFWGMNKEYYHEMAKAGNGLGLQANSSVKDAYQDVLVTSGYK